MLKLDESFRDQESLFFNTSDLGFESKKVFLRFLFDISLLDPYPGSQNLADPTDPDPKHCAMIIKNN